MAGVCEGKMARSVSRKLAPNARKLLLRGGGRRRVQALVQVAASQDPNDFQRAAEALGAEVTSILAETAMIAVEVAVDQLPALADLEGVVYIEAGEKFSA